jgi:hypothetical protein
MGKKGKATKCMFLPKTSGLGIRSAWVRADTCKPHLRRRSADAARVCANKKNKKNKKLYIFFSASPRMWRIFYFYFSAFAQTRRERTAYRARVHADGVLPHADAVKMRPRD